MASATKTPKLALPQWTASEKPERTDFNDAFDKIDDFAILDAWHAATLVNSWAAWGGQRVPSYRKDAQGKVSLSGFITGGASNSVAFTLPAGYRPTVVESFCISDQAVYPGFVTISSNGEVQVIYGAPGVRQMILSGVSFFNT